MRQGLGRGTRSVCTSSGGEAEGRWARQNGGAHEREIRKSTKADLVLRCRVWRGSRYPGGGTSGGRGVDLYQPATCVGQGWRRSSVGTGRSLG